MVLHKKKRTPVFVAAVAVFGTAMSSLYITPELQSDIIDLTFDPGSIDFNSQFPEQIIVEELNLVFTQWHDVAGQTMYAGSLTSINVVQEGSVLSTGNFAGTFELNFSAMQGSTAFVGFRSAGNVGWFKLNLGGIFFQPIVYDGGQYGSSGENLTVGGETVLRGDINCDGSIDLLDVQPFVQQLQSGEFLDKADMNQDGVVDLLDVAPFVDILSGS